MKNCVNVESSEASQIMKQNNDDIKYYLINYSPLVFINGYMYKGNYKDTNHLMEAFCNSFEDIPQNCQNLKAFAQYQDFRSYSILKFVLISILSTLIVIVLLITGFYFFYRKKINSTFKVELNNKINDALSKYYNDGKKSDYKGISKKLGEEIGSD